MDRVLLEKVSREIEEYGLRSQKDRLKNAQTNLEFYRGDFHGSPVRDRGYTLYDSSRYPRNSLIMQRVVDVLTMNLYAEGPSRKLAPPEGQSFAGVDAAYERATSWLAECYKANRVDSMWAEADALSVVSQVSAFQVEATDDLMTPIQIELWDSSQFCVWFARDKARKPELVALLDVQDGRNRLRLYSDEIIQTYMTIPAAANAGLDAPLTQKYRLEDEIPNAMGVLPFAFVHFRMPVTDFWTGSPGNNLRAVNDGINFQMTESFDCVRYNLRPILTGSNLRPDWKPPAPVQPGDFWNLSGASDTTSESASEPEVKYLQADASFVEAGWSDMQSFLDHTLEMNGIPPSVIRMTQDSVRSGVAIIAEQLPVIGWAKKRQNPFGYYESDLAKLVLMIGARHLGNQSHLEYRATSADLEMVAANPGLVLKWPNMYPRIPGQEQDTSDDFRLEKRLVSKTMLLMERENLTREEAEARLQEVADDLKREQELFADIEPDMGAAVGALGAHELELAAQKQQVNGAKEQ